MKHSGSTALALWSLLLKLSISIKHRHLNNSDMSCCTLLCCTVLNSLLSITNIIIFRLTCSLLLPLILADVGAQLLSLIACSCLLLRFLQLSVAPKRHQQAWGMCYSGFNRIRWVHVHANF